MKKIFLLCVLAVVSLGFTACDNDDNAVWYPWRIDIIAEKDCSQLKVGETVQLELEIVPDFANATEVTWWTENEDVATVTAEGLVTAVNAGETTINVRSDYDANVSASIKVKVEYDIDPLSLNNDDPVDQSLAQSRKK